MKLVGITEKTCVCEIQAMVSSRPSDFQEQNCRPCKFPNYEECPKYLPIGRTEQRFTHLNLYNEEQK